MTQANTYIRVGGQDVDGSLAPASRTFRDAWFLDGNHIVVDMPTARLIHREKLRQEREPRFAPLDNVVRRLSRKKDLNGSLNETDLAEYLAAETAAQALRELPESALIDAAATPEALVALTIDVLLAQ